ncbi:hypothetical protein ACFZC5_25535 [Nocardia gamkensis]|uniref:hypothetical protein n=1 Tax=Nocardia gamkensis TaxID=352869 RepID=UPI0036EE8702
MRQQTALADLFGWSPLPGEYRTVSVADVEGSVMVTFEGTYRPKTLRECDHLVAVGERAAAPPNRLYKDEFEIR